MYVRPLAPGAWGPAGWQPAPPDDIWALKWAPGRPHIYIYQC